MASLARSLKSPSFLSPRRRPAMSGRTLSNSSELSLASNHSGRSDDADFAFSAPGTPAVRSPSEEMSSNHKCWLDESRTRHHDGIAISSPRSAASRPIAIELPQVRKKPTTSIYTPTEPLSARGDVAGGYFPLHEDPDDRLHRTHPFHLSQTATRSAQGTAAAPPSERADSQSSTVHMSAEPATIPQPSASPQISSYLPAGFHDHPLPLGKYYPSNYESRTTLASQTPRVAPSSLMPPTSHSDSKVTTRSGMASVAQDSEVRQKLLQYQRDMVTQATMAATDLLGPSKDGAKSGAAVSQRNAALQELRLSAPAPHKPISPRLLPLGSPGPVTPMELESGVSSYLDKAIVVDRPRMDSLTSSSSIDLTPRTA